MFKNLVRRLSLERPDNSVVEAPTKRLRFWRSFMTLSLIIVVFNSLLLGWLLSSFLETRLMEQDHTVSMEFVNSIVRVKNANNYFHGKTMDRAAPEMEEFFRHVSTMPGVFRSNVYGLDRSVLWSTDASMIGKTFADNEELELAFKGKQVPEIQSVDIEKKAELAQFPPNVTQYSEYYLPIWSQDGRSVIGAVELYKHPTKLLEAINTGRRYVWLGAAGAASVLFLGLGMAVFYASRVLRQQEVENVEMERLAVVGEMASTVAHGLRNPLASIRSCAELALEDDLQPETRESIADIVSQSDRLAGWISSFLNRSRGLGSPDSHPVNIDEVIQETLNGFSAQLQSRNIESHFSPPESGCPLARVSSSEFQQVLNSIISNCIEAIESDGELTITRKNESSDMIGVVVRDSGPGVPKEILSSVFTPFSTTKPSGMGIGLALARRIIERIGGNLEIANSTQGGAEVRINIPTAAGKTA